MCRYIPYGDYHTHSKYSDGRATIFELVNSARAKGLKEIAITDHGPRNTGTGVKNAQVYLEIKKEVERLNSRYKDINILAGAEADVISCAGDIDIPEEIYKKLDILLIGLHPFALPDNLRDFWKLPIENLLCSYTGWLKDQVVETNTQALKNAIIRHKPYAVAHPGLKMPVDLKEIAAQCAKTGAYFEINTGHNYLKAEEIAQAASSGVQFIINSDAHFTTSVGELSSGINILFQAGISPERVVNLIH